MEELRDTSGLEREIREDARKKADRTRAGIAAAVAAVEKEWSVRLGNEVAGMEEERNAKLAALETRYSAAIPIDRKRAFLEFAEHSLKEAVHEFVDSMDAALRGRYLRARMREAAGVFASLRVKVTAAGIDDAVARSIAAEATPRENILEVEIGPGRTAITVVSESGDVVFHASLDRLERELLSVYRSPLADALLGNHNDDKDFERHD